ncbi:MAG: tripartite tricarboxylate transporter permease [Burkholderiales bacterium]
MDASMLDAAWQALVAMSDPTRLGFLFLGALLGLILGILPGIGGVAGTAILIPFTFGMDPVTAFAFLLGLASTTATGDPIPAILFGIPGGAGSAATVLDGLPMARRGEAGRALSAAYMSSLMGGLFGAALMAVSLPLIRPLVLSVGSPELLALAVFGISMVAVLSGNTPLRGLAVGCFGLMLAMVGTDPQSGTQRWTLDSVYLWEGVPLIPVVLGLFALPELCDLAISRTAISGKMFEVKGGRWEGAKDCFRHWWLIVRCSWIGSFFGAIPGIGGAIIDWLAYGHAVRTEKGAQQTFGTGDVRGVIASESANNAKEGGALVPTVAFGVPGSAGMAVLIGAFAVHGMIPGPDMLTKHLHVTYSMVWSIALANIVGAGLCYLFSVKFALLATLRYTLILPTVLSIVYVGAFSGTRQWGDLFVLLLFGALGWIMKQMKWPRPPLLLGFVLGDIFERYMFISVERYGWDWLTRPLVMVLFALALFGLMRPLLADYRAQGGLRGMLSGFGAPTWHASQIFYAVLIAAVATMLWQASGWNASARIVPTIVGSASLLFLLASAANAMFRKPAPVLDLGQLVQSRVAQTIHMDLASSTGDLPLRIVVTRGAIFFAWLAGFMASTAVFGLIPAVLVFVVAYMRLENREPWRLVVPQVVVLVAFFYFIFDQTLNMAWPETLLGTWFPALKIIPSL